MLDEREKSNLSEIFLNIIHHYILLKVLRVKERALKIFKKWLNNLLIIMYYTVVALYCSELTKTSNFRWLWFVLVALSLFWSYFITYSNLLWWVEWWIMRNILQLHVLWTSNFILNDSSWAEWLKKWLCGTKKLQIGKFFDKNFRESAAIEFDEWFAHELLLDVVTLIVSWWFVMDRLHSKIFS